MSQIHNAAKQIANLYNFSPTYPEQVFEYSSDWLELQIRAPSCFPPEIAQTLSAREKIAYDDRCPNQWASILRSCPAIESIYLAPGYRGQGFFQYLVSELLSLERVLYVCVNNVYSIELAQHLTRSPAWSSLLPLNPFDIKRLVPYCSQDPEAYQSVIRTIDDYIDVPGTYLPTAINLKQKLIELVESQSASRGQEGLSRVTIETHVCGLPETTVEFLRGMRNYYTDEAAFSLYQPIK